jgi:hypothetical protein
MGRSKADRELAAERRAKAWELYCQSVPQNQIALLLGISESATSKLVRQAAACAVEAMPQTREELAAELHQRWGEAERVIREEIDRQRREGRITTTITTRPDGTQVVEQQHTPGVDAGLLRCLSTHADRRARQALNQTAVADGAHNPAEAIRVFLTQPMGGAEFEAGRWGGAMTAAEWSSQQDALPERSR